MEARFRRPTIEGRRWRYGMLVSPWIAAFNNSQDVNIVDSDTGGIYVIRREFVQVRVNGPRGGRKWQPLYSES